MRLILRTAMILAMMTVAVLITLAQQPVVPEGVEVDTRGPIHEAFAQPASPKPVAPPIVPKKPPEPITELPPDQRPEGDQMMWIPGYWAYDDERGDFLWVSGIWRAPPPKRRSVRSIFR